MKIKRSLLNLTTSAFFTFLFFEFLAVQVFAQNAPSVLVPLKQQGQFDRIQAEVVYESSYGNGQQLGYLEYLPSDYAETTAKFPLLISLHGIGQRGTDSQIEFDKLRKGGQLAKRLMQGQDFPFIIITPQQPEDVKGRYQGHRQWDPYIIDEVLERVKGQRRVDLSRVYICGESMGGGGVWSYLELFGDKVAAAVSIAGTKTIGAGAACNTKINNTPVWAFHADGDPVVNVKSTLDLVNALNRCNPPVRARQTIFSGRSHNVWDWVYDFQERTLASNYKNDAFGPVSRSKDIFSWMLSFHLKNKELAGVGNQEETAADKVKVLASAMENAINGLRYAYYEGAWTSLPDFRYILPVKEGKVSSVILDERQRDDNFGFVFKGDIKIEEQGEYTFYLSSDDGSKLLIDGRLVIDQDGQHSAREKSEKLMLNPGMHSIELAYFERLGNEKLDFSYSGPGFGKRTVPTEVLYFGEGEEFSLVKDEHVGLNYSYYEESWTALPDFNRIRPEAEGVVPGFLLSPRKKDADFAFRYKGYLVIDNGGEYEFYTSSDDGSKLYIDGQLLVDNDGEHAVREKQGKAQLTPGLHAIEVVFFQHLGNQHLEVSYSGPTFSKMLIPSEKLFTKVIHPALECRKRVTEPIGDFVKAYPSNLEGELKVEYTSEIPVNTIITLYSQYGDIYYTKSVLLSPDELLQIDLLPLHIQRGFVYMKVESENSVQTVKLFKN